MAKLILLAPAYNRAAAAEAPPLPVPGPVFTAQTHDEFIANWIVKPSVPDSTTRPPRSRCGPRCWTPTRWAPPGLPAVRRAPISSSGWGWTAERVKSTHVPTLMALRRKRQAGSIPTGCAICTPTSAAARKVFLDLICASHNAMWEKNHLLLFKASLEWLESGTANGQSSGELKLGG